jgi:phenylacetate-coenzyme A ligase PaaK-like adenylate-forming protein
MTDQEAALLHRILTIAAPQQAERFRAAGLIQGTELVAAWQAAFLRLEPIDQATVRSQPGTFLANAQDIVYRGTTSGSRGQYFTYFAGTTWNQMRLRSRQQSLAWWGIGDDTPIVNVASRLFPVRSRDCTIAGEIDAELLTALTQLMAQPVVLRGYPSRLCEVALQLVRPVSAIAVICTGESLYEFQRSLLESLFQAPVINEYGCQETGISGLTCPEVGRLHLDRDRCLYEVIDGQLVTTDLYNEVMPLVRYQCGDVLRLHPDACPCGRPGLTAELLGRVEDTIETKQGKQFTGAVAMPAIATIPNYRVIREQDQLKIYLNQSEFAAEPLQQWIDQTFGQIETEVLLIEPELGTKSVQYCDCAVWLESITKGNWKQIFGTRVYPNGVDRAIADLVIQLIRPRITAAVGLPATTQRLIQTVANLPSQADPALEQLVTRILLLAATSGAEVKIDRATPQTLDHLIASLVLGEPPQVQIESFALDRLHIHHLLKAFEVAVQRTVYPNDLKPLLGILIGDLTFFAPRFCAGILSHWLEVLQGKAITAPTPTDPFVQAWLNWRKRWWQRDAAMEAALSDLAAVAATPAEQARVQLERGYGALIRQHPLDPQLWLPILRQHAGGLTQGARPIDPIPWSPILRSLAPQIDQPDLAYQCLLLSACPTSSSSNFEAFASVNSKQSMLMARV